MSLNPGAVGARTEPYTLAYDWRTLVLYALGIGAKHDELDYLYEGRGPRVFPTFAVVPTYPVLMDLITRAGGDFARVVHGGQSIRVHAPLPPAGELTTTGVIVGIYDLKRMAQMVFDTQTFVRGTLVFETQWSLIFLGDGGFGGERPPKSSWLKPPDGQSPSFVYEETVSAEQALLYRLSGDTNPLHVDPEFAKLAGFERGPILHGLATYGFCARALIKAGLGGDAQRLTALQAQFKKPVWPGEVLRTEGFLIGEQYALRAFAGGRPDVVAQLTAEVTPSAVTPAGSATR